MSIKSYELKGREKIEFGISLEIFMQNPINYTMFLLPKCLAIFKRNKLDYDKIEKYVVGEQDIIHKKRPNEDVNINNIVVENHLWRQVNFKTSFIVGNPIDYSSTMAETYADKKSDLTYLNKYDKDASRSSKDIEKYMDCFMYGHAYRMVMPKNVDFDKENEAPYDLYNLSVYNTFCVYESGAKHRKLFSCIITNPLIINDLNSVNINTTSLYTIYLNNSYFELEEGSVSGEPYILKTPLTIQPFKTNPIIEYKLNKFSIGIPELVMYLQDGLNALSSLQFDDIEEFVNSYIVFKNVEIDEDFLSEFEKNKKKRVIAVLTSDPNRPAEVNLLKETLNHADLQTIYERIINAMYDIVACPRASGNVTSGGDTGAARLLGNGWETAQNQAQIDTTYFIQFEYEELKSKLEVCYLKDTNIKEIHASDIDIKYNINMSDNLLIKAEALKMLNDIQFPKEASLNIVKLTNDSHGIAEDWQKNVDTFNENEKETQQANNLDIQENNFNDITSEEKTN